MPKKKQVIFQNSIPGKFIPRNPSAPGSAFPPRANDNRYNAKIAQLLASSPSPSSLIDEKELASQKSSQENSEPSFNDSSCIHSKLFHRRIVTLIETLKKPTHDLSTILIPSPDVEQKSRPITFGQLRQATMSTALTTVVEDKSACHLPPMNNSDKPQRTFTSRAQDRESEEAAGAVKSSIKHHSSKERLYYSPSLEKLFEEQNAISQSKKGTADEIPISYSSTTKVPNNLEATVSFSTAPNTTASFYISPSTPQWTVPQSNQSVIPPPLLLNQQNLNRPPPPSYFSSVASNNQRVTPNAPIGLQSLVHPPSSSAVLVHSHPPPPIIPHLRTGTLPLTLPRLSLPSLLTLTNPTSNSSVRPPPPRYQLAMSTVEHSQAIPVSTSTQQSTLVSTNNQSLAGFDREFSRLLYGKDPTKTRRKRQKRKAYSDPVKECIEEAHRTFDNGRRRVTTHLNKPDFVDGDDDDETEPGRPMGHKYELNLPPRRRVYRQVEYLNSPAPISPFHFTDRNSPSTKKALVPANPHLKQRIPSFLRVYSHASPSTDILLQWNLFNLSELESFYAMITRLYKSENLARVQLYEIYRTALLSALASKTSTSTDDENSTTNTMSSI